MSLIRHPLSAADAKATKAIRASMAGHPKLKIEPATRAAYDEIFAHAPVPEGVSFEQETLGGVRGLWCRPAQAGNEAALLYLHGGGYIAGSASAYRNFVGHIATRARVAAFVADYALAPERPFPAAMNEVGALHRALVLRNFERIALCGDSAGGGLALSFLTDKPRPDRIVGVAALSPWIDLSVSGNPTASGEEDPILSKEMLAENAAMYLGGTSSQDVPSPLRGDISTMPPVRIDVGTAEVLLDDALRFATAAERAGLKGEVHVWEGMSHVFPLSFSQLGAAAEAIEGIGTFLGGVLRTR